MISHFGRPDGLYKEELSLKQVIPELENLLNCPVKFSSELVGKNIEGDSESYRRAILKMREVKLWGVNNI